MLRQLFCLIIFTLFFFSSNAQKLNQDFLSYIDKNKDYAVREMERAGIPASIKLAQGLLESNAGKSYLARKGNNHFGIKCGNNWKGKKVYRKDDEYNAQGKLVESCFRSYRSTKACYIAHSEFLRDPSKNFRYGFLFRLDPTDYKRWAKGLKKAGYATSATYAEKLIRIIEQYELYKYDRYSSGTAEVPVEDILAAGVFSTNDVKYTNAEANETVAEIAKRTDTSLRSLLKYNENLTNGNQSLKEGDRVYIQPKRNAARGKKDKWHTIETGQNLFFVSQQYGVKLSKLMRRNRLEEGMEPAEGEILKLRGCKVKNQPKLATAEEIEATKDLLKKAKIKEEKKEKIKPEVKDKAEKKEETVLQKDSIQTVIVVDSVKIIINDTPVISTPVEITPPPPPIITIEKKEETLPEIIPQEEPKVTEGPTIIPDFTEEELPEENASSETPTSPAITPIYHTVQNGDTLWSISKRYNTSVDNIKKLSELKNNTIQVGQKLRVK